MADENLDVQDENTTTENRNPDPVPTAPKVEAKDDNATPDVDTLVQEQLKEIKSKLDNAFAARDEALKKLAEREETDRQAEIERLKSVGKDREAHEMEMAKMKADNDILREENIKLTRDAQLSSTLSTLNFENERASGLAFSELQKDLIKNEEGTWVHKSGISLQEAVAKFAEDPTNSFLFKQPVSSGTGVDAISRTTATKTTGSLFDLPQDEVLKRAAEGTL